MCGYVYIMWIQIIANLKTSIKCLLIIKIDRHMYRLSNKFVT